jgi:hypothetical protein
MVSLPRGRRVKLSTIDLCITNPYPTESVPAFYGRSILRNTMTMLPSMVIVF